MSNKYLSSCCGAEVESYDKGIDDISVCTKCQCNCKVITPTHSPTETNEAPESASLVRQGCQ